MRFDAYIFDLDGTLLDTFPDLVRLTNMVLDERGWSARTSDEVLSYVGNGGRTLLRRAVPADASEADVDAAFDRWCELYPAFGHALTQPYQGIPEVLSQLKRQGAKLGVLSNKFDAAVQDVIADHFPGVFDVVCGENDETPRKPDPTGLMRIMSQLGVPAGRTAYVGDSATDIEVALRAGAFPIGVTWGYRSAASLEEAGARELVDDPPELLRA